MTYAFKCLSCGHRFEETFPMGAVEARERLSCSACGGTALGRDFNGVQFRFRTGWRQITHYDALPDDVKGAGPYSEAHRKYAAMSRGGREL